MAEVLAKKEELADRLEKANEEAIASAIAEEEQLTREIQAENNDLETDNENYFSVRIIIPISYLLFGAFAFSKPHFNLLQANISGGSCGINMDWIDLLAEFDGMEVII